MSVKILKKERSSHKQFLKTINDLIQSSPSWEKKESAKINRTFFKQTQSIIKAKEKKPMNSGEVIYQLVSDFYYVNMNEKVLAIADELFHFEDIHVLAVVDYNLKIKGIINRKNFLNLLGKAYGRDIYKNYQAIDVIEQTELFFEETNILSVAETLKDKLKLRDNHNYITVNSNNEFTGIFSTKSILIYLSDKTQNDLILAQRLQKNIVKDEYNIKNEHFELSALSRMAQGVGGDFYTVKNYASNKWIIAVCDISGKGISASLLSCILGGMFNTYDFTKGLKKFIQIINEYIYTSFKLERYITGIIIDYDDKNASISICDLGHSYIYIYKNSTLNKINLQNFNIPLGVERNITPHINNIKLDQNEIILLLTDGFTEQVDENDETLSEKLLEIIITNNQENSLVEIKNKIIKTMGLTKDVKLLRDDITLLLLQNKKIKSHSKG